MFWASLKLKFRFEKHYCDMFISCYVYRVYHYISHANFRGYMIYIYSFSIDNQLKFASNRVPSKLIFKLLKVFFTKSRYYATTTTNSEISQMRFREDNMHTNLIDIERRFLIDPPEPPSTSKERK